MVFLILSISMLTQSAPAADPEPCVQFIDIPYDDCGPVFDPTTGHFEEKCVEKINKGVFPCDDF